MAKILLIETASAVCSAAIAVDGQVTALEETLEASSHAALLTLQIDACVKKSGIPLASLDAVALSSGPGAYTSLRVGASVAKGICYALDKPLIAVDTLLALAGAARDWYAGTEKGTAPVVFVPALDARRQEIWTAVYDAELQILAPAQPLVLEYNLFENYMVQAIATVDSAPASDKMTCAVIAGNGSDKIRSGVHLKNTVFFSERLCSAANLAVFAELFFQNADFQDVAYFEPFYMKLPNITKSDKAIF